MRIVSTPEARSIIREQGGLLFVWISAHVGLRGFKKLEVSTEPPPDALDYDRVESPNGFLVFLDPHMPRWPRELVLEVSGRWRRRLRAYWDNCAFVA